MWFLDNFFHWQRSTFYLASTEFPSVNRNGRLYIQIISLANHINGYIFDRWRKNMRQLYTLTLLRSGISPCWNINWMKLEGSGWLDGVRISSYHSTTVFFIYGHYVYLPKMYQTFECPSHSESFSRSSVLCLIFKRFQFSPWGKIQWKATLNEYINVLTLLHNGQFNFHYHLVTKC